MSIIIKFIWKQTCPARQCAIDLRILISTIGHIPSYHSVSKY